MKTLFNGFADKESVFSNYNVGVDEQKDVELVYAEYNIDGYEGNSFVLFARKGKLYEVNGSHCSCYGLEDQWSPEETSADALFKRLHLGNEVQDAIKRWQRRETRRARK